MTGATAAYDPAFPLTPPPSTPTHPQPPEPEYTWYVRNMEHRHWNHGLLSKCVNNKMNQWCYFLWKQWLDSNNSCSHWEIFFYFELVSGIPRDASNINRYHFKRPCVWQYIIKSLLEARVSNSPCKGSISRYPNTFLNLHKRLANSPSSPVLSPVQVRDCKLSGHVSVLSNPRQSLWYNDKTKQAQYPVSHDISLFYNNMNIS